MAVSYHHKGVEDSAPLKKIKAKVKRNSLTAVVQTRGLMSVVLLYIVVRSQSSKPTTFMMPILYKTIFCGVYCPNHSSELILKE